MNRDLRIEPIFAFTMTHRDASIEEIGDLLPASMADGEAFEAHLEKLRVQFGWSELLFLNTCNRILFVICGEQTLRHFSLSEFYQAFNPDLEEEVLKSYAGKTKHFHGFDAIKHYFAVTASLDSLVVGEREILGQMRKAYRRCRNCGLTGDTLRLINERAVVVAKEVYTKTRIGENAVSVVSLAFRELLALELPIDTSIALIGAGQSNSLMAEMLQSRGYQNFQVFNRSLKNGERLAQRLNCEASDLDSFKRAECSAEVLIFCTASNEPIFDESLYGRFQAKGKLPSVVVDLGVPYDVSAELRRKPGFQFIDIEKLRATSAINQKKRQQEVSAGLEIVEEHWKDFQLVYHKRQLEKAMASIPDRIRSVKDRALEQVFQKEISEMDEQSRETLQRVVDYLEKKYISIPITVAKDALEKELKKTANRKSD